MIQLVRSTTLQYTQVRLDIYDKMTNTDYRPLMTMTSQFTGNSKTFRVASANYWYKERYVELLIYMQQLKVNENFMGGSIYIGDTDFPLGFYDVTIYQNTSSTNLDPTGLTTIYTGLANVTSTSTTDPVEYSQYTTNDSDTDTIYITNT